MFDDRGFTLLEVLVVVAIFAILTSLAFVGFRGTLKSYELRGAARQVYSDMQMARLKAIKEGQPATVAFSGTSYTVTANGTTIKTADLTSVYKNLEVCSSANVTFKSNGTASSGWIIMRLDGQTRRVYISSSGTGNVRIDNEACPLP